MLEAFDELGLKPSIIAGTSIGAIFGAAYASGIPAAQIRAHTEEVLGQRFYLLRELFAARAQTIPKLWRVISAQSALLDSAAVLDVILPARTARMFESLSIPLKVVATDFYAQEPAVISHGSLRQAVAASMALPVIFQPVIHDGRALIDGGLVNPLPFDIIAGQADVIVAIDVAGAPVPSDKRNHPTAAEALFASSFIFERSLIKEKLRSSKPDIYIDGGTSHFQALDFLKVRDILAAAEPAKARLKLQLQRVLGAETVSVMPPSDSHASEGSAPRSARRGARKLLLPRLRDRG
jgi:NTE family protein